MGQQGGRPVGGGLGPIYKPIWFFGLKYIIIAIYYLTWWTEDALTRDCTKEIRARLIFEHIVVRFGCSRSINSNQSNFLSMSILLRRLGNL